jgi:hypothetical protein
MFIPFYILFHLTFTNADEAFISISYYDGLGEKFRVETASSWDNCRETRRARKIYLHRSNELREVAYWDKQGRIHEAGKSNNPLVHKIVNDIFSNAAKGSSPCDVNKLKYENQPTKNDSPEANVQ